MGFVTIPGGAITQDNSVTLTTSPSGGPARAFYSWLLHRWVSARVGENPLVSSPAGDEYAYTEYLQLDPIGTFINTRIHVVDIATGGDRVVVSSGHYGVRAWDTGGLLLYLPVQGGEASGGFRLDPRTGEILQFTSRTYWIYAAGYVWAGTNDSADPTASERYGAQWNTLLRVDPRTGAEQRWLYRPGEFVRAIGGVAPDGSLVTTLSVGPASPGSVVAVTSPDTVQELWHGEPAVGEFGFNLAWPDGERTWLLAPSGDLSVFESGVLRSVGANVASIAGLCR